jgi:hypothetical protein
MLIRRPAAILAAILGYFSTVFSQVSCFLFVCLGHEFPNQLVVVWNRQTFLSERKSWEEYNVLANLLGSRHMAHCPRTMLRVESELKLV